jgi:hypothetical protein
MVMVIMGTQAPESRYALNFFECSPRTEERYGESALHQTTPFGMYQNYDGTDHHGVVIAERRSTANYVDYGNSYVPLQNPVEGTSVTPRRIQSALLYVAQCEMLSGADCGGHTNRHLVLLQGWIGQRLRAFHE